MYIKRASSSSLAGKTELNFCWSVVLFGYGFHKKKQAPKIGKFNDSDLVGSKKDFFLNEFCIHSYTILFTWALFVSILSWDTTQAERYFILV